MVKKEIPAFDNINRFNKLFIRRTTVCGLKKQEKYFLKTSKKTNLEKFNSLENPLVLIYLVLCLVIDTPNQGESITSNDGNTVCSFSKNPFFDR